MTLKELRDEFIFRYKIECSKRNVKEMEIPDRIIAKFISNAEQALQDELGIIQNSYEITPNDSTEYYLPDDFGEIICVKYNNGYLPQMSDKDYLNSSSLAFNISANKIRFNTAPKDKIKIYYYVDISKYQPSKDSNYQNWETLNINWDEILAPYNPNNPNWGAFDGSNWDGNIAFPDKYSEAIIFHMLSNFFEDFLNKYLYEVDKYKWKNFNFKSFKYKINGGIG